MGHAIIELFRLIAVYECCLRMSCTERDLGKRKLRFLHLNCSLFEKSKNSLVQQKNPHLRQIKKREAQLC